MTEHTVAATMSREEILSEVLAAERETHDLLEQAAAAAPDREERELYRRLARREEQSLDDLTLEERRLEAVEFVQKALDV